MLAWAESERAGEKRAAEGEHTLTAFAFEQDPLRPAILARRGYTRTDRHGLRFGRPRAEAIAAPDLPPGYRIRTLRATRTSSDAWRCIAPPSSARRSPLDEYRVLQDGAELPPRPGLRGGGAGRLVRGVRARLGRRGEPDDAVRARGLPPRPPSAGARPATLLVEACRRMQARGVEQALVGTSDRQRGRGGALPLRGLRRPRPLPRVEARPLICSSGSDQIPQPFRLRDLV